MRGKQESVIGCLGSGRLLQRVQQHLAQAYHLLALSKENLADQGLQCAMLLYCDDHWHFQTQQQINQHCLSMGLPWLRAYCEFGTGIIGPCVFPSEVGCLLCAETRRLAIMTDIADFLHLRQSSDEEKRSREQPWLTAISLEVLSQLIVQEVSACLQSPDKVKTHQAVLYVELETLHCQRHHFLPEPECPACGRLPPDTAEAAMMTLQSRPKLGPFTYRARSLTDHARPLLEAYVDPHLGLISALMKSPEASIASVTAQIGISDGERPSRPPMSSTGRTLSYRQSQLTAITEALERYGGQRPKGKRTGVRASYRQLGDQALDPTTLGLHTAEQYALPGYRYVPYHHDLVCRWVWGYSFQRQRPTLIPERVAYYGLRHHDPEDANPAFVYEISNGCALGNCLEEAIFHGILEVAERDAFLMTWYAQLSLPRLDPRSARDPLVGLLIEHLEHTTGYTISVLNSTLDHAVACCWVLAVDEQNRDGMPKAMCAAGSHPHPEQAVLNALLELVPMTRGPYDWFQKKRANALEMLVDPLAVREMEDHSLLYCLPEAFERLYFLSHSQQQYTFQQAFDDFYRKPTSMDLRDDLRTLIDSYLRRGIDLIVVDQTTPEQALQHFSCVKVIMPGMLPMTFGHRYRRQSGFQRLYQLPYQLGYRTRPLTDAELNPHPHPFP
jgi:ribosomal protein S12 methylthiotransferase accessory factor